MLHAFNRRKSQLYKRYLGYQDGSERKVMAEDEITSVIFSPLSFLPDAAVGTFWRAMVEYRSGSSAWLPSGPVTYASMQFWPLGGPVEPDLVVQLGWASGETRTLLIELKWRAALKPEDQLQQQWQKLLSKEQQQSALHLFIAPDVSGGENALTNDVWQGRLLLRPWHQVLEVLEQYTKLEGHPLKKWAVEVTTFLSLLHIASFGGFSHRLTHPIPAKGNRQHWFWNASNA